MIDLHCHIIPWVDDGADDAETACKMAAHAVRSGVTTVVATPHCNLRGALPNYRGRGYDRRLAMFRALLRQHRIPLKVLPGAEVFAHPDNLRTLLAHRRLVTLNHSHYLLVEFDFGLPGDEITRLLGMIAEYGLTPVVAHPERYDAVQAAPELAMHWFSEGCLLQLNKGSLLHRLGDGAYETSMLLLRRGFADVIASDAHDTYYRPSGFQSLLPVLERYCAPAYVRLLLEQNPARILSDRRISRKIEDLI